jgi:hypothetical protein
LIRKLLLAAGLLWLPGSHALAQRPVHPHKRVDAVAQGMTPAQVRALLGEPERVRRDGSLTYLYYPNGCGNCAPDYVVVRDCRVVGGRFESPSRVIVQAAPGDQTPPPAAECRAQGGTPEPGEALTVAPPAVVDTPRRPPPPTDTGPGGALPVQHAELHVAATPEPEQPSLDPRAWRQRLGLRRPATHLIAVPAASISSPTAFGAQMGEAFVAVAYQERTRYTHLDDGAAVVGFGIGDRERLVGLEVALSSYSTLRGGGPLETGGLSFKLHRAIGPELGVAVGYENVTSWGGSDAGHSPYVVATRIFRLRDDPARPLSAVAATLGVGAGRFRSEQAVVDDRKTANVFGAIGVQVAQPLSLTADWNGQDLFAAVSVTPIHRIPLVLNAGFADITGNAGDGVRFVASAGLGFRYLPPFF